MNKENCRPQSSHPSKPTTAPPHAPKPAQLLSSLSASPKDYHDHYLRFLITANAEYFHAKLRPAAGRAKDTRLKIPCRTGATVYRKDYKSKQAKYQPAPMRQDRSVDCIKTNNFLREEPIDLRISDKTNYQKEYRYLPVKTEHCRRIKKRVETASNADDAPRFMETQNKTDFLNWAGRSYVPSMKPTEKSAVTNLPFEATTVYKSDFQAKNVAPTAIVTRAPSFPNFGCVSMLMKSNYSREYEPKHSPAESSCKPRHFDANLCKQFKGTTEYKREFLSSKKEPEEGDRVRTVEELATMIIDL